MVDINWDEEDIGKGTLTTEATDQDVGGMPAFSETTASKLRREAEEEANAPSALETIKAGFRRENFVINTVSSAIASFSMDREFDHDFDPFQHIDGTEYEEYREEFVGVPNEEQMYLLMAKIDKEKEQDEVLEKGGVLGVVAQMAGGVLDLPSLAPGGAIIKGAKGGVSVGKTALSTGLAGVASGAITETGLQASTATRTIDESMINIVAEGVFSASIGSFAGYMSKKSIDGFKKDIKDNLFTDEKITRQQRIQELEEEIFNSEFPDEKLFKEYDELTNAQSVGAAKLGETSLQEETLVGYGSTRGQSIRKTIGEAPTRFWIKATSKLNPAMRLKTAGQALGEKFPALGKAVAFGRQFSDGVVATSLMTKKNLFGISNETATEHLVKLAEARFFQSASVVRKNFSDFRDAVKQKKAMAAKGEAIPQELQAIENMSEKQFGDEISKAMRRGDAHENKYIADSAKEFRKNIIEPYKKKAIEAGLLPEGVDALFADSYLHRMWNKEAIIANEPEFRQTIRKWATDKANKITTSHISNENRKLYNTTVELDDLEMQKLRTQEDATFEFKQTMEKIAQEAGQAGDVELSDLAKSLQELPEGMEPDYILNSLEQIRQKIKKPKSLTQWIVENGGILNTERNAAELSAMGITNKTRPGILSNKRTLSGAELYSSKKGNKVKKATDLDDLIVRAWEDGYIDVADVSELTQADILKLIDDDFSGTSKVYRTDDLETARMLEGIDGIANELEELGIPVATKKGDIKKAIMEMEEAKLKKADGSVDQLKLEKAVRKRIEADFVKAKKNAIEKKQAKLKKHKQKLEEDLNEYKRMYADDGALEDYAKQIEDTVVGNLKGMELSFAPKGFEVAKRGPLANKTLDIADIEVDGGSGGTNFLENDINIIMHKYARTMSADIGLQNKFGTTKFDDMAGEFNEKISRAIEEDNITDPKELQKIERYRKDMLNDLSHMWDRVRGATSRNMGDPDNVWARVSEQARLYQLGTNMGMVVSSSAPDVAMPLYVHGLKRYLLDGIVPLIRNIKKVKMSGESGKLSGVMTNVHGHSRIASLAELGDPFAKGTAFERFNRNLTNGFMRITGLPYWNDFMQMIGNNMSQNRTLEMADLLLRGKKINKKEMKRLTNIGIDESMLGRIGEMYKRHGSLDANVREDFGVDVRLSGVENWTDEVAQETYLAALRKEIDMTTIQPDLADTPLWMNTPTGKLLGQFKSFAMAANQKVLIAGLQRSDAAFVEGSAAMIAMGMAVYAFRQIEAGREISDDPMTLLIEGVDRSGIATVPMLANNSVEAFNIPVLSNLTGEGGTTRYRQRRGLGAIGGPIVNTIDRLNVAGGAIPKMLSGEEPTRWERYNANKLLVGNNHILWRQVDKIQFGGDNNVSNF